MDFDQNDNISANPPSQGPQTPPPQPPIPPVVQYASIPPGPRRRSGWKIFFGIVLTMSILANIALFLMFIGMAAFFAVSPRGFLAEETIRKAPAGTRAKIAVISVEGIIYSRLAEDVRMQLERAAEDKNVKGLIVRVNSPGGTVSGSDQIYHEISKFRKQQGKPVIAFMQRVAASGGYYASVACEQIMAEPTVITGSIGVIGQYFVVQELLEEKLGVMPVTIKSGMRKDWPSSFRKPTPEELQYYEDSVIMPAYDRFLDVVIEGRRNSLTAERIRELADGGIFVAEQAKDEKLIDSIGYFDDAIALIKSLAGVAEAHVVKYGRPFSLAGFLSYRAPNTFKLDRTTLYDLSTPQILYLWSAF